MGKSSAPAAPDYTPIAMADMANTAAETDYANKQLAWAKEQYADSSAITQQVVDSALKTQDLQQQEAVAANQRYTEVYQPIEDKLVDQVNNWDSASRVDQQQGAAEATAEQQGAQARTAAQQNLESFGIQPASTRYAAMDVGNRTATAASAAAAGTNAANLAQQQALGLESEAINVGRGYPGQISNAFSGSVSAGNSANSAQNSTVQTGSNTMNSGFSTGMSLANSSLANWGNTLNMSYNNQLGQYNANQQASSGIGSIVGDVTGMISPIKIPGLAGGGAVPTAPAYPGGSMAPPPGGTPGGAVPTQASPTGGAAVDDVPAALTAGEFVVPKDVTSWLGEEKLQKIIQQARTAKQGAGAKGAPHAPLPGPPAFASRPQQGAVPVGAV